MRKALQDQQDVNLQLRAYIDSVLLNIMEKYPELLEVRTKWTELPRKGSVRQDIAELCDSVWRVK